VKYEELTEKIIGCAYTVYNRMGFGFLESVYYLTATNKEIGLVLNFGPEKMEIKRKIRVLN
jgi:hypothetical protein